MLRPMYVVLLRLHPRHFREEFADEMLWIFDQAKSSRAAIALLGDAVSSLATQWMLRPEFDEPIAGSASDRVPVFYVSGSDMPPPGALLNGAIGSLALFAAASFALAHSGGNARVFTYYGGEFHAGPPVYGKPKGPSETGEPVNSSAGRSASVRAPATPGALPAFGPRFGPPWRAEANPRDAVFYFNSIPVLAALDTDHDGQLSAEEIANAPAVLLDLDQNHDGKLQAEECGYRPSRVPGAAKRKSGKTLEARLQRERITFMRVEPVLAAIDADHDTTISRSEIGNAPAALKTLDRNHDGRLTLDEVLHDPVETTVASIFRLDTNFDGKISRDEKLALFGRPMRTLLAAADRNRDGYVTWDELAAEIRRRADLNHDGVVTWEELMKTRLTDPLKLPLPFQIRRPTPKPADLR